MELAEIICSIKSPLAGIDLDPETVLNPITYTKKTVHQNSSFHITSYGVICEAQTR